VHLVFVSNDSLCLVSIYSSKICYSSNLNMGPFIYKVCNWFEEFSGRQSVFRWKIPHIMTLTPPSMSPHADIDNHFILWKKVSGTVSWVLCV